MNYNIDEVYIKALNEHLTKNIPKKREDSSLETYFDKLKRKNLDDRRNASPEGRFALEGEDFDEERKLSRKRLKEAISDAARNKSVPVPAGSRKVVSSDKKKTKTQKELKSEYYQKLSKKSIEEVRKEIPTPRHLPNGSSYPELRAFFDKMLFGGARKRPIPKKYTHKRILYTMCINRTNIYPGVYAHSTVKSLETILNAEGIELPVKAIKSKSTNKHKKNVRLPDGTPPPGYVERPDTGRLIRIDCLTYKTLVKVGMIEVH